MVVKLHFDGRLFGSHTHGGISRVFLNLFREFGREQDIEPHLHLNEGTLVKDIPKAFQIEHFPNPYVVRPGRLFRGLNGYIRKIGQRRHFAKFGPGIFHSTYYTTYPTPQMKQVLTLHDMIFEDHPELFGHSARWQLHVNEKKECISAADVIVCDSEFTRSRLALHYPKQISQKLVSVIHLGCHLAAMGKGERESGQGYLGNPDPFVLHVGSRYAHKNFGRLLEALARPGLSGTHLVSIGGGEWTDQEKLLINKLRLDSRCHNIPAASDLQLAHAYRSASAVVVPSITEGFGLPLLEALSFGCSIACSRGGSLPEVGGDVPFYFDPFSIDEMQNAIVNALSASDREARGAQGAKRAAGFSWQACAAEYVCLYRKICSWGGRD